MQQSLFGNSSNNILPFNGEALFYPQTFTAAESDTLMHSLVTNIAWKHEAILMFGKQVMQPRLTAWYGDSGKRYSYSGITMQPLQWTGELLRIKQTVENIAGIQFNSALLNYYRNGQDSMGWHRDDEKELGTNPVIASVSIGASRKFKLRYYSDKSITRSIQLTHGSLLLMRGETQHYWEHQLPKTSAEIGARINITFRVIV